MANMFNQQIENFLKYLKDEFPTVFDNHYTYELAENIIKYAYEVHGHSKNTAKYFITDIFPEIDFDEINVLLPERKG